MMERFRYDRDSEAEIHLFGVAQLNAEMVGQVIAAVHAVKHPCLSRACKPCRGSSLLWSIKLSYPSRAVQAKVGRLCEEEMLFHSIHP